MKTKKRKKLIALFAVATLSCMALTGCGVKRTTDEDIGGIESNAVSNDADSATSGTITVYTALEDDIIEKYLQSFYKKYPDIKINLVRDATGTIIAKAIAEKDNPVADVVWGVSASVLLQLDKYNLIKGYTPNGADRVLDQFKDTKNEDMKWVGIEVYETAFLVNTEVCEAKGLDIPTCFNDLLDPQYENQIIMPDPTSSGTGMLTINGILQTMGNEAGWEYLEALNNNIASYTTSGSKPAKMAASSEIAVGLSMGYRCAQLYQEGNPVVVVFPNTKTTPLLHFIL